MPRLNEMKDKINMLHDITLRLGSEAATVQAGKLFSNSVRSGLTVYLSGNLGAGKTTFVRGILHGMGFSGRVKSPTYTLLEPYQFSKSMLYHFDFYRFNDTEEWEAAGFRDYFNPASICLVEWPEKAGYLLPKADVHVHILSCDEGRLMQFVAHSILGCTCLTCFE